VKSLLALGFGYEELSYHKYSDQALFINLYIHTTKTDIDDFVNRIDYPVVKKEKIVISGINAIRLYNGPDSVMNITIPHPEDILTYVFVPSSVFDQDLEIFNQILSTFKFIE